MESARRSKGFAGKDVQSGVWNGRFDLFRVVSADFRVFSTA